VVADEVRERVPAARRVRPVTGRADALLCEVPTLPPLLALRTVVAPFLLLPFDVPRPKSLSSGEHLNRIVDAVKQAERLDGPLETFAVEAAGSDSPVFRRLAQQVSEATGLTVDRGAADCVLRFRRAVEGTGWDVLVRLTKRPLATRPWRVRGYPAAVNATIAAAMVRLTEPTPQDRVLNLMCGSGTLLVERLLHSPAAAAVGVDRSGPALVAATANLEAAGLADRAVLHRADIADPVVEQPFDVVFADPPWGDKMGRHDTNEKLHDLLLRRAHEISAEHARLAVLTHEIRVMERCLRTASDLWQVRDEVRVFAKGHHPRIYVLDRNRG